MQKEMLSAKLLADQCIVAGRLDDFFHELLFHLVQRKPEAVQQQIEDAFFQLAALILKERYHLFIDEYLSDAPVPLPEVTTTAINDMDGIDLFFEQYYNLLKERYLAEAPSNAAFFRDYHRRDLKQDSMLRAFIIVRNRLLNPSFAGETVGWGIAFLPDGLTGTDTCHACLRSFLTVKGMRTYAAMDAEQRESLLHEAGAIYNKGALSSNVLQALPLESLPPGESTALQMTAINKRAFRASAREYLCQFTWLLA